MYHGVRRAGNRGKHRRGSNRMFPRILFTVVIILASYGLTAGKLTEITINKPGAIELPPDQTPPSMPPRVKAVRFEVTETITETLPVLNTKEECQECADLKETPVFLATMAKISKTNPTVVTARYHKNGHTPWIYEAGALNNGRARGRAGTAHARPSGGVVRSQRKDGVEMGEQQSAENRLRADARRP